MMYRVRITMEWRNEAADPTTFIQGVAAVSTKHALKKALAMAEQSPEWHSRVVLRGWPEPRLSVDISEPTP